MNDFSQLRKERLIQVKKFIVTSARPISIKKVVSRIQLDIGLTEKRALEYIQINCEAEGWLIKDDVINLEGI